MASIYCPHDSMLSVDILGYLIQFLRIDTAAKLSVLCKALPTKLLWSSIVHFDNGAYHSSLSNVIAEQLLKNADDLTKFESLIISTSGNADVLNALCLRLAPRLRRFELHSYSTFIQDKEELFQKFSPKRITQLKLSACESTLIRSIFTTNGCPNLFHLQISPGELEYDSDLGLRPLLASIASSTCQLRHFGISLESIRDDEGFVTDAIKEVAVAKSNSLESLDFQISLDGRREGPEHSGEQTFERLDVILGGAVSDWSKWHSLPAAIEAAFGIPITGFRIAGANIWQRIMINRFSHKRMFSQEHSRALFDAVYPPAKSSAGSRINSFEFFINRTPMYNLKKAKEDKHELLDQYRDWMLQTLASNWLDVDLSSTSFKSIALGLLGILNFMDCCGYDLGDLWLQITAFGSAKDSSCPLNAFFGLMHDEYDMGGPIDTDLLVELLLKHRRGLNIDLLAPIGPYCDPLIIYLREAAPKALDMIIREKSLIDPLQQHPQLGRSMFLFAFLHPLKARVLRPAYGSDALDSFSAHIKTLGSEFHGVCYKPSAHIRAALEQRWPQASMEVKNFLLSLVSAEDKLSFQ